LRPFEIKAAFTWIHCVWEEPGTCCVHPKARKEKRASEKESEKEIPMLKKVAVFVMTLASLGAVVPATAAAAERGGRAEKQVVVEKRVMHRRGRRVNHRVVVRRTPARKIVVVKHG
jgi:hypothetical protein